MNDILATAINEMPDNKEIDFRLYPNPASTYAYLEFEAFMTNEMLLEVYNELGTRMEYIIIEKGENNFTLNTGRYPGGIYFVKLSSGNIKTGTKRLVIIP